jgi:hypothetical protein
MITYQCAPFHIIIIIDSAAILLGLGCHFGFLILYTVSKTPWMGISKASTYIQEKINRINAHRNPCLQWVKTVHAFDHTTVIGAISDHKRQNISYWN